MRLIEEKATELVMRMAKDPATKKLRHTTRAAAERLRIALQPVPPNSLSVDDAALLIARAAACLTIYTDPRIRLDAAVTGARGILSDKSVFVQLANIAGQHVRTDHIADRKALEQAIDVIDAFYQSPIGARQR